MFSSTTIILILTLCLTKFGVVNARTVSALADICARGAYAFCPPQSTSNTANTASRDLPQPSSQSTNNNPPRYPLSNTPPPLPNVAEYCQKYQEHYQFYCSNSNAKDPKAQEFCPTYVQNCNVPPPVPDLPPEKIQKLCTDYQGKANLYCFRPTIPTGWQVPKDCDLYLKYCVGTANGQPLPQNKTMEQVIKETYKPCDKYQGDYIGFCVQNPVPYNDQVADFCKQYRSICVPVKMPTANSLLATNSLAQPQVQMVPLPVPGQNQVQMVPVQSLGQPQMQMVPVQAQGQPQGQVQMVPVQMVPVQQGQGQPVQMVPVQMVPVDQSQMMQQAQQQQRPVQQLGNPTAISNPLGALSAPSTLGNPASQMIQAAQPPGSTNPLGSNPLAFGQQTSVGNMAGYSSGAAINPFGQVATGKAVNAGPVGVSTGQSVDFSGIPGMSSLGNLFGKRRRKRDLSLLLWILAH